jgi:hypothetical protein
MHPAAHSIPFRDLPADTCDIARADDPHQFAVGHHGQISHVLA